MADFDEYEYLEKAVDDGPGGDGANGRGDEEPGPDSRMRRGEEEGDAYEERRSRKRSRSIEGERSRGRRERDPDDGPAPVRERERDRSRERDERDREFRGRDRDRERSHRGGSRYRDRDYDRRDRDGNRRKKEEKEEPEADPERDQRTVFAYQINLKADERDVYEFFSRAGKVRDVRLIMDRNSRRSKGVGYIEFYDAMSVPMAIALRGQLLLGTPVMVKPSEAEKNLAAQTALPVVSGVGMAVGVGGVPGMPGSGLLLPSLAAGSRRLQIGNLHANMNEEQLKQVVEPFGALESVLVPTDPATGQCKGFGYVTYVKLEDARVAQQYLNDLDVAGLKIKVQFVPEALSITDMGPPVNPGELDDDEGGGFTLNAQSRAALMQKLDRTAAGGLPGAGAAAPSTSLGLLASNPLAAAAALQPGLLGGLPGIAGAAALAAGLNPLAAAVENIGTPSQYLSLRNMFNSDEVDDEFEQDIKEDVEAECEKFGKVLSVHVDRQQNNPTGSLPERAPAAGEQGST